ncbi:glycosyltransferase [Castellaniella ginsengisoli]|uniref:Glycosyltransferase n=1 Tax=Castellaniella ginsengisoli TaxID=546114 RepID=A0AB39DIK4_9BURK
MRILLVVTGLRMGGAERQVADLSERLAARGHAVAIAYLTGEAAVRPGDAVELHALGFSKTPFGVLRGCRRLARLIRAWRPDVVHSHMVHANLIARVIRLVAPVRRLICTAHSPAEGGRAVMWAYRLTDRLADLSTHVSREAVAAFERAGAVPRGRMRPVLNGVDVRMFSAAPGLRAQSRQRAGVRPGMRLLLSVGRLAGEKNHASLLRAFARLAQPCPDVALWIAGDGPLRPALLAQRAALGLDERVVFLGERHDVPDLMRAADVFVLSSRFEGFGLVVAEAMASGTLVVAADAGGVAEVLGGTGILVPPEDDAALARGLVEALAMDSGRRAAMTASARRRVEDDLDIERVVDVWLELYRGETAC